ncbi:AHH domain-containing protein [Chryseobacterium scophthalmum]|uniref:AHH domain-containing protein n=1 Tax=Chryseobacterium scophthalmum TaxID=59733 RepID=UPI001AEC544D|nr:AHH domain-containing protein [Chryseobacterium scophthalmum]
MLLLFNHLSFKILTKFGFKKIWLEKHGKFMELWGEFNSKVLLMREDADGNKTVQVDTDGKPMFRDLNSADYKKIGRGKQVGVETTDGLIVSNSYERTLQYLKKSDVQTFNKEIEDLEDAIRAGKTESEIREMVKSKGKVFDKEGYLEIYPNSTKAADAIHKRGTLHTNMKGSKPVGADWEAHHLIPVEVLEDTGEAGRIMRQALEDGFDFNCAHSDINGEWAQRYSSETRLNKKGEIAASPSGTHSSHPIYTDKVKERLTNLVNKRGYSPKQAAEKVAQEMRGEINKNPNVIINELFKPKK